MEKIPCKKWMTIYELVRETKDDRNSQLGKSLLLAWFKENKATISFYKTNRLSPEQFSSYQLMILLYANNLLEITSEVDPKTILFQYTNRIFDQIEGLEIVDFNKKLKSMPKHFYEKIGDCLLKVNFKEMYSPVIFNITCSKEQLDTKTLEYENYMITTGLQSFHRSENINLKEEWKKYYEKYTSNRRTVGRTLAIKSH